jgi:hypothetical protein
MFINDELRKIWKEAVMSYLRYYPNICVKALREKQSNIWSLGYDFN